MIGASMNSRTVSTTALGVAIAVLLSLTVLPAQKATERAAPAAAAASLSPLDRIQIQQLVRKYAWALDSGDNYGYAYADLFTPDGIFVGTNQGPGGRSYQGRDPVSYTHLTLPT